MDGTWKTDRPRTGRVRGWFHRLGAALGWGAAALLVASAGGAEPAWPVVHLGPGDRILVLAPHPDDEVIACGGIIQQAVAMKLPLRVVVLTHGDNNEWSFAFYRKHPVFMPRGVQIMGEMRHDEALAAALALGYPRQCLRFLGYPDFGTMSIWHSHWNIAPPMRAMMTRARAVPYADALRPGAPYKGEEVIRDLTTVLREFRPTKVFVSHPADYNADHRAFYLFARVALWDLQKEMAPVLLPYLVHYPHWPEPPRFDPNSPLRPPAGLLDDQIGWQIFPVTAAQNEKKIRALEAHRTQFGYSGRYLRLFVRQNELFGDYPIVQLAPESPRPAGTAPASPASETTPQELIESGRAAWIGTSQHFVRMEEGQFVLTVRLTRPLAEGVEASVYVFGYRSDRAFALMPKIHVTLGETKHAVYDQNRKLPATSITVTRSLREIIIRFPIPLLGNPDRILTADRTYLGDLPLDWASWRVIRLPRRGPS